MTAFIVVALALMTGSFLTVVADAADERAWLTRHRSRCPHCRHVLGMLDLIPLVSFLALRGRCRFCHKPIPTWHVGVELATLALFLAVAATGVSGVLLATLLVITALLLALTVTDLRFFLLPDVLVGALAIVGLLKSMFVGDPPLPDALIGAALGLVLLGGMTLVTRERAMGWGDVKLAGAMGLILGWGPLLLALAIAFIGGGVTGVLLILAKRATLKSHVPFGPFLTGATMLLLLFPKLFDTTAHLLGFS